MSEQVCVCVCVCMRESIRQYCLYVCNIIHMSKTTKNTHTHTHTHTHKPAITLNVSEETDTPDRFRERS